jgi:hypothetical protein
MQAHPAALSRECRWRVEANNGSWLILEVERHAPARATVRVCETHCRRHGSYGQKHFAR